MFANFKDYLLLFESLVARATAVCRMALILMVAVAGTLVSPLVGILIFGGILWRVLRRPVQPGVTHGSAQWSSAEDLCNAGCLWDEHGVAIGRAIALRACSRLFAIGALFTFPLRRSREAVAIASAGSSCLHPLEISIPSRFPHSAIFGATGSGKTSCFAVPQLLNCGDSMICLDSKGELARMTARHRERRFGHRIVILDPFNTTAGSDLATDCFNPLDVFREDTVRMVDEARRLATSLVETTGAETDKFWSKSSITLLTCVLTFLMSEAIPEEATLNRMRDIVTDPKIMDQMLTHMQNSDACYGILQRLSGQMSQLEGQTKASVYSVANAHVAFLDSLPIAEMLSHSTFDPRELLNGQMTIYLCLPVDRLTELAGLQRIILSTLINLIFAGGEARHRRVRFLLDEAATLGSMDPLYSALQFGRSYGLRLMFLFQSTAQIERCFPGPQKHDFRTAVASVFCGINDYETAKEVSDWVGQTTVNGRTVQAGMSHGKTANTGIADQNQSRNWGSNDSTSYAETGRALITPAEVLQLASSAAIALIPGVRPVVVAKVPWFAKCRRHLIRRTLDLITNLLFVMVSTVLIPLALWAVTIGRTHPIVVEARDELRRIFMN